VLRPGPWLPASLRRQDRGLDHHVPADLAQADLGCVGRNPCLPPKCSGGYAPLRSICITLAPPRRLGDAALAELWTAQDRAARDLLPPWHGRAILKTGASLLMFGNAADAVNDVIAYKQGALARHDAGVLRWPHLPQRDRPVTALQRPRPDGLRRRHLVDQRPRLPAAADGGSRRSAGTANR